MATAYRNTFVNWTEKRLQQSLTNGGEFIFPNFYKYESVPLRLRLVEAGASSDGLGDFSLVDISNLTLRVTVNDTLDDAAPLAEQQTWTLNASQNYWEGVLDLNTAAMNTYMGSNSSMAAYIQISVAETGGVWRTVYQRLVTIENSVAQPTTSSPDPVNTYRTAQESDGLYLSGDNRPGLELTLRSPSNNWTLTIGIDDNGTIKMQPLPYPPA